MTDQPPDLHPLTADLQRQLGTLRAQLAGLLAEAHDLLHVVRNNLLALYQAKLGPWELACLRAQAAAAGARRRLELVQAALNHGKAPDLAAIDQALDEELATWRIRIQESAQRIQQAEQRLASLLPAQDSQALKQVYRSLVKRLHPDLNPGADASRARLWEQVQDAYARAALDELRAMLEIAREAAPTPTSTPGAVAALRQQLGALQEQVAAGHARIAEINAQPPFTMRAQLADDDWIAARRQELETRAGQYQDAEQRLRAALAKTMSSHGTTAIGNN